MDHYLTNQNVHLSEKNEKNYKFSVDGISCGKCVKKIEDLFITVPDIKVTKIDINNKTIQFKSEKNLTYQVLNNIFTESNLSKYTIAELELVTNKKSKFEILTKLFPLFLIISYLVGIVFISAYTTKNFSVSKMMSNYMGGFFIIFSFFKFLNIKGFVNTFSTYDPIANKWKAYGYFYAAFELIAGILYLLIPENKLLNIIVIALLSITSIGVYKTIKAKKEIQCACLGTVFNLPMTRVTIIENVIMISMAILMVIR